MHTCSRTQFCAWQGEGESCWSGESEGEESERETSGESSNSGEEAMSGSESDEQGACEMVWSAAG